MEAKIYHPTSRVLGAPKYALPTMLQSRGDKCHATLQPCHKLRDKLWDKQHQISCAVNRSKLKKYFLHCF